MRLGLHIGKFDWPGSPSNIGETLAEIAKAADDIQFCSMSAMNRFFQPGEQCGTIHGPVGAPMLEDCGAGMPNTHRTAPLEVFGDEIIPVVSKF